LVVSVNTNLTSAHQPATHNSFTDSQELWMGSPNTVIDRVPLTDEQLEANNACLAQLVFWTSCTTVRIHIQGLISYRDNQHVPDVIGPHPGGQVLHKGVYYDPDMEDTVSNQHEQGGKIATESSALSGLLTSTKSKGEVVRDIIIVGRSIELKNYLNAIIVHWRDGIAYRVGHTLVSEENWIRCDRTWRLVTLA